MNIIIKIINKIKEFLPKKRDMKVTEIPITPVTVLEQTVINPVRKKSGYSLATKRAYQDKNRDAINEYQNKWQKEYRIKNKDEVDAKRREYQKRNREKLNAYQVEWNRIHKAEISLKKRERYLKNKGNKDDKV